MELNTRQKKAVNATESRILCLSGGGSGKTRVLSERVIRLIEEGIAPSKIVCITFTRMAAEEMRKRFGDKGDGMFIGTIHSYANYLCLKNGIDTSSLINEQKFDKILEKALTLPQHRFDKVEHLLVDEFQDVSNLEFRFMDKIPSENIFFIADNRQGIYGFKGATDAYLKMLNEDPAWTKYYLTTNYRCAPNIIQFADDLIATLPKLSPPQTAYKEKDGIVEECPFLNALEELEWSKDWGSWFILCRTNEEISIVQDKLMEKNIPSVTFKKADLDLEEMGNILKENKVKILTIHCCMSGDTLILTSNGIMPIKEVVEQANSDILVYNGKYYDKVKQFIKNGKELTYKITSKCGSTIRLTENHDVIILSEDGLKKIKVKDLQGKENILLRKNVTNYLSKQIKMQPVNNDEIYYNVIHYSVPEFLTPELAELVGMITADGTHNKTSIHYVKQHKECVERFAQLIEQCFNKKIEVKPCANENAWLAECNSRFILTYLYKNFDGIENNNKFISSQILQSGQDIQCSFLKGLFEDGTVSLKKGKVDNITLTFKNSLMTTQLQTLLFSLGIDASFITRNYKGKNPLNYCYIYSNGISVFKEKIGFISKMKQEHLKTFEQKYYRKNKSSVFKEIMIKHKDELYINGQKTFWNNLAKNQGLTEGAFLKYYNLLNDEQKKKDYIILIKEIFENYLVEEIASIEPYKEEDTYCLTMEHEPQFIQNGFLMGNSKGLESPKVIVVGAKTFNEEERKVAYVAATRAEQMLYWCPSVKVRRGKYKNDVGNKNRGILNNVSKQMISFI